MSFAGKHAIVTGAGSGIGAALCRALAAAGADVLCTDIDAEAAERTASTLGANVRAARLDVTDAAAVQTAVDAVIDRAGRLDLMFNNAGIVWGGDTELLTLDQWNAIITSTSAASSTASRPRTRRWSNKATATSSTPLRWPGSPPRARSPAT
jgi:NAD(P)-dependent dehydrogenase (short-subunit alcohol dehydrogenase family)